VVGFVEQKVEKRLQPLAELRELASSESVDAFTLAYTNLLQNHPDCPVCKPVILSIVISNIKKDIQSRYGLHVEVLLDFGT
jgi:hypothetical protein